MSMSGMTVAETRTFAGNLRNQASELIAPPIPKVIATAVTTRMTTLRTIWNARLTQEFGEDWTLVHS